MHVLTYSQASREARCTSVRQASFTIHFSRSPIWFVVTWRSRFVYPSCWTTSSSLKCSLSEPCCPYATINLFVLVNVRGQSIRESWWSSNLAAEPTVSKTGAVTWYLNLHANHCVEDFSSFFPSVKKAKISREKQWFIEIWHFYSQMVLTETTDFCPNLIWIVGCRMHTEFFF